MEQTGHILYNVQTKQGKETHKGFKQALVRDNDEW